MLIRTSKPDEWVLLRELRYLAMAEAPFAAALTLAKERSLPDEAWQERARPTERQAWLVAESGSDLVGTALVIFDENDRTAYLGGMWVVPALRRRGLGRALTEGAADWAKHRGAERIKLEVSSANAPALHLYEATGFSRTETTRPIASEPPARAIEMLRGL